VKCREPLGWQLLAFHNLAFYGRLMADIRANIRAGTFLAFRAEHRELIERADPDNPPGRRPRIKPTKPRSRGAFALRASPDGPDGFISIQHTPSGEIMHSVNAPDVEASRIYVEQSALIARALTGRADRLVVWDVGLGAGHNAMALVRALDRAAADHAPVELVSFERDLDAFRLALDHVEHFPHLRHRAPHVALHRGSFQRERLAWTVCEGDFLATFASQPQPDVIFYDPFSYKTDAAMWTLDCFERVFGASAGHDTEMFTYSSSTAVRAALLAAGFVVARGAPTGAPPFLLRDDLKAS
jgi:queuine tRNA-ribosyltransferase